MKAITKKERLKSLIDTAQAIDLQSVTRRSKYPSIKISTTVNNLCRLHDLKSTFCDKFFNFNTI